MIIDSSYTVASNPNTMRNLAQYGGGICPVSLNYQSIFDIQRPIE